MTKSTPAISLPLTLLRSSPTTRSPYADKKAKNSAEIAGLDEEPVVEEEGLIEDVKMITKIAGTEVDLKDDTTMRRTTMRKITVKSADLLEVVAAEEAEKKEHHVEEATEETEKTMVSEENVVNDEIEDGVGKEGSDEIGENDANEGNEESEERGESAEDTGRTEEAEEIDGLAVKCAEGTEEEEVEAVVVATETKGPNNRTS